MRVATVALPAVAFVVAVALAMAGAGPDEELRVAVEDGAGLVPG
jgi:hypothetical protein